jgi:hypothetical protein
MILLDGLLDLKCAGSLQTYVSEFNLYVARLQSMQVTFNEALLIALLLRGLPPTFEIFCSTVRHRERMPTLDQLFGMLKLEEKMILRKGGEAHSAVSLKKEERCSRNDKCEVRGCGKLGHTKTQCWILHPELAPVCKNCGQSGHFTRYCRKEDQAGHETVFADLPPITL